MLAVDAEHEHCSVLSGKVHRQYTEASTRKTHNPREASYLRSVDLLFHDGDLLPEDGSVVLDHHGLLFHVSSSKQPQALEKAGQDERL